jgi:hypothetical protein
MIGQVPVALQALLVWVSIAIGLVTGGPTAAAAGQPAVSLDYSCRLDGGRIGLVPSTEQTYRIIGSRQRQTITACNRTNASGCHSIVIHRFIFDCDGFRVPWIEASEALLGGRPWKVAVTGGRMTLHDWSSPGDRHGKTAISLPVGFAPSPIGGLRFTTLPTTDRRDLRLTGEARSKPVMPAPTLVPSRAPEPVAPTVAVNAVPPALPADDDAGWTATVSYASDSSPQAGWPAPNRQAISDVLLVSIALAALLLSGSAVLARQMMGPSEMPPGLLRLMPAGAGAARGPGVPPPPSKPSSAAGTELPPESSAKLSDTLGEAASWAAVLEMQSTATPLLLLVKQMVADHVREGELNAILTSDLERISDRLDGPELATALASPTAEAARALYCQILAEIERIRTIARIEHQRALDVQAVAQRPPATTEEAYRFLGVNPKAEEGMAKRLVDALRQNWHPDLARDEADRCEREDRIKRINAAWDLIRSR